MIPGRGGNLYAHLHVRDAARVLIAAAETPIRGCWPVSDRRATSWPEFFSVVRSYYPRSRFVLLPKTIGVRYYATEDLTAGHLSSMLTNSQEVAEHMTEYLVPRHKGSRTDKYLPAVVEILAMEDEHNATLAKREEFLSKHIEKVCDEIFITGNFIPLFSKGIITTCKGIFC